MQLVELGQWVRKHAHILVYVLGSGMVSIWTLLRFFTQRTIFDLVSQQVIVHQWLQGSMSPAHMGQTAYVPKMLLLYAPLDSLPGSPRLKLILVTLVINIATFVLLGIVLEKLLRLYGVRIGGAFYAALLWLSAIAGSVFWIEFANSRNLEVVGGVFWLYLGLRYLKQPSRHLFLVLCAFGSLLFFSDPLQLYMSAAPLLLYAFVLTFAKKQTLKIAAKLLGVTVVSYLGAKLLFYGAGHWLQLSFTETGGTSTPHLTLRWLAQSGVGAVKSAVALFAGAADAGRLREVANLSLLLLGFGALIYTAVRRLISRQLLLLAGCVIFVDVVVYIGSGQAEQGATMSRYLIMLAPVVIMVFGTVRLPRSTYRYATLWLAIVLGLNLLALGSTLGKHWNTSFPQDAHIESTYDYVYRHPGVRIYASTDTAMPLLYLHHLPGAAALPVGCLASQLVRTHFSMDHDFAANAAVRDATAGIVLDGDTIANNPNVCTVSSITAELGQPERLERLDDGSIVMLYQQSAMQLPD